MKKKIEKCKKNMKKCKLNLDIADNRWKKEIPDIAELSEKVKQQAFSYAFDNDSETHEILSAYDFAVNVRLSNDVEVQRLNKEFRGMDKPTNVLSFANLDFENFKADPEDPETELGDIIIAFETMQKEAKIENISLKAHYCHLLTHGFLHILGFDHIEDDDAEYMESFEVVILAELGIENPYEDEE